MLIILILGISSCTRENSKKNITIEGRVTAEKGLEVEGVDVEIYYEFYKGHFYTAHSYLKQKSNEHGEYSFFIEDYVKSFRISFKAITPDSLTLSHVVQSVDVKTFNIDCYYSLERKVTTISNRTVNTFHSVSW